MTNNTIKVLEAWAQQTSPSPIYTTANRVKRKGQALSSPIYGR